LLELRDTGREVRLRLGHGAADSGDDLNGRLHELVPELRLLPALAQSRQRREDLTGVLAQQLALGVDELKLPFDAQRRTS
jgi:hypothetical protein